MSEIVKYNNYLNVLGLKGFTSIDLNFLMAICAKMRDKDIKEVTFEFSEIKRISNYDLTTSNKRFVIELERMNRKLMEVTCRLEFDSKILMFVLFPTFEIDLHKNILTVSVNERFKFILNELIKDFTAFELAEFVNLNSKYSKNLYRLLKQFRTTGIFKIMDIKNFQEKMDCPKSYPNKEFTRTILIPAIKELQEKEIFKNLVCTPKKAKKRGSPVIGYTFTFDPEKVERKQTEQPNKPKTAQLPKPTLMTKSAEAYNNYPQRNYSEEELEELELRLLQRRLE